MSFSNQFHQALADTADSCLQLGWSVIPLWGDTKPEQAKVAAVTWSAFQHRRATEAEIQRWFSQNTYAGLGIIVGAVSGLAVLDFDSHDLITAFERELPDIAATRTVLTRRGQHLYFRIPPHLRITSRKLNGIDLLSDGHYVVSPPTLIDGHEYRVGRGGQPRLLTQQDIKRLNAFLDRHARNCAVTASTRQNTCSKHLPATGRSEPQEVAFLCPHEPLPTTIQPPETAGGLFLTAEALVRFYHALAQQAKRNVALFKTSCLARDHGWRFEAVAAVLAGVHADELAKGRHICENRKARHREAVRTIRSAFSKPPRAARPKDTGGLFNSIREKLMQLRQTFAVRVLEGLHLEGLKAGQIVSERMVLQLLKGRVGRHSVRLALAARTPAGEFLFERVSPSLHSPHSFAATKVRIDRQTNAYVNETKPDSMRGRQEQTFRIPSPQALCERLGVAPSSSDPVALEDLQTAKKTRQALQRELIRRRPGLYLRKWLGDRLGLSERTISRYSRHIPGLNSIPTFTQTPLRWDNLTAIPAPEAMPAGTCLEDSTGKRWPALKGIAQKLLGQGRGVRLLVRSLNYYWCGPGDPPLATGLQVQRAIDFAPIAENTPVITLGQQIARLIRVTGVPSSRKTQPPVVTAPSAPPAPRQSTDGPPVFAHVYTNINQHGTRRRFWKPLQNPTDEALAARLHAEVNARAADRNQTLSRAIARQWVATYDQAQIAVCLEILCSRRNIQTPAAFLLTLLRSASKFS